jgi:hypothetical protein
MRYLFSLTIIFFLLCSCDHVENPYPPTVNIDLDTNFYPGVWSDYESNEWPSFEVNSNTLRNVIIEDFTGHQCVFCPAAADLAHDLHMANPTRVFTAGIHAGPDGIGDFQMVSPPDYPTDFTNPQGVEIGSYFGETDGGFPGNPRGTVNRYKNGTIFQSPAQWTSMTDQIISNNDLKVNIQSKLNYYEATKGAYLHIEIDPKDASVISDLSIMVYLLEDSLVGDQKMSDNSHNTAYVHRDTHRGNLGGESFGRALSSENIFNDKYLINYSFAVPNQLDGLHNASNMHLLICAFNQSTWEIYQVTKQKIE